MADRRECAALLKEARNVLERTLAYPLVGKSFGRGFAVGHYLT
jgi:hypothetical protein